MKKKLKGYYFIIGVLVALFVSICACFCVISTGYVNTKRLIIYSGTAEKAFDNSPLTSKLSGIKNGSLKEGHNLIVTPYGSQTEIGASLNLFHYAIVDSQGNSVEDQYRIIEAPGILVVHEEGWIDWEKIEEAKKYLDRFGQLDLENSGLDLSQFDMESLLGNLDFEGLFGDQSGKSIEDLLGMLAGLIATGKLPELPGGEFPGGEGGGGGGGQQRFDNNLQKGGNGLGDNPEREVLKFYSDNAKSYYLRYESFGDYNGSGFETAPENTESIVSPLYYAGLSLSNAGQSFEKVYIENLDDSGAYYLPYYSITGITDENSDVRFSRFSNSYSAMVNADYDYLLESQNYTINSQLSEVEQKYREFVYQNYLTIDETLKSRLRNLTNFYSTGVNLVNQIKDYVQNSATYNLSFEEFPSNQDMVYYFLTEGKEGICQHFSAAATMIYRSYGIPARYTCGYKVNALSEQWTVVTEKYAHAWVEIYVDGFGWVPVEVTGGAYDEVRKNVLEIKTVSLQKPYDGQPFNPYDVLAWEVVSGNIPLNHYVVADTDSIGYPLPNMVGEYENSGFGYKIIDSEGNDITSHYVVSNVSYGTLTISQRPITIQASSADIEYTGSNISLPEYEWQEGLVEGETIIIETSTTQIDIGEYENDLVVRIENADGFNVTNQYLIDVQKGYLNIIKIQLDVFTHDYEHEYDGHNAICELYSLFGENKMLEGHTHSAISGSTINLIKEIADEAENIFTVVVLDGVGTDVTDMYYQINLIPGTLKVIQRQITLHTGSDDKTYDGTPLKVENNYITDGTLLEGDRIVVGKYVSYINMGEYDNVMTYSILDAGNNDVSSRYKVTEKWGKLLIYASEIKVRSKDAEKFYDGEPLTEEGFELISGTLLPGHEIRLKGTACELDWVGSIVNSNEYAVYEIGTDNQVAGYKVTHDYGMLTIKRIQITIQNKGASKVYDGTPLTCGDFTYVVEGQSDLDSNHELRLVGDLFSIVEPGNVPNHNMYAVYNKDTNELVEGRYDINYDPAEYLVIKRIPYEIKTKSASKEYDGKPLYETKYDHVLGELLDGHYIVLVSGVQKTTHGIIDNNNEYDIVMDVDGVEVSVKGYYNFKVIAGTLTVTPRTIKITTPSDSKVYDGQPLYNINVTHNGKLLSNHEIIPYDYAEILDIGKATNTMQFKIQDKNTETDVTDNYLITVANGTLEILAEDSDDPVAPPIVPPVDPPVNPPVEPEEPDGPGNPGGGGPGGGGSGGSGAGSKLALNTDQIRDLFDKELFTLYTDKTRSVYLRGGSVGDYVYGSNEFKGATIYETDISPLYYIGQLLEQTNGATFGVQITSKTGGYFNLTPYFTASGGKGNDINLNYNSLSYTLNAYAFDFLSTYEEIELSSELKELELAYREFVYENYLNIDSTLEAKLLSKFGSYDGTNFKDKINYYASQVQNYAEYDLDFSFDSNSDIIDQFLEMRKGICQHYAATATMLYRAVGIPARFVSGYMVDAIGDQTIRVKGQNAHAWVEVYADGLGWIPVEVTGTTSADEKETMPKIELAIFTPDAEKVYDGKPLFNTAVTYNGILLSGHQIRVVYKPEITNVGKMQNNIKVKIVDAESGEDVSSQYQITYMLGNLEVKHRDIIVFTKSKSVEWEDENTTISGDKNDVYVFMRNNSYSTLDEYLNNGAENGLVSEHGFTAKYTTLDKFGECDNYLSDFRINNASGIDVSSNYKINYNFGKLYIN